MEKKWRVLVTINIPQVGIETLEKYCRVSVNRKEIRLSKEEIMNKLDNKEALCCGVEDIIDSEVMDCGPNLKVIANYGVGYNNIDIRAATERGIMITNTPGVLSQAVAEMTWCLLLCLARRAVEADSFIRAGRYKASGPRFFLGTEIGGKTLGIIGAGRIGTAVAIKAAAFNIQILYYDLVENKNLEKMGAKKAGLDYLLKHSDFVSLHISLTGENIHLIGERELALMKDTTYLINTSRGKIIDKVALVKALKRKQIAGAALDVYENEPQITRELLDMRNVVLAPHIGSATRETRDKMSIMVAENCIAALKGEIPPHLVNTKDLK